MDVHEYFNILNQDESSVNNEDTAETRNTLDLVVIGAIALIEISGVAIAEQTAISESVVEGLFTAVSTSLPELVTSIAAVKQGALTLAVRDIIGGNSFDVLFIAVADFAYREGSIYHALTQSQSFIIALTILMTGILLLGLLRREKTRHR